MHKYSSQVLHLQYGMYAWPCAVVLAQYLWFHRSSLPGKAVLEVRVLTLRSTCLTLWLLLDTGCGEVALQLHGRFILIFL